MDFKGDRFTVFSSSFFLFFLSTSTGFSLSTPSRKTGHRASGWQPTPRYILVRPLPTPLTQPARQCLNIQQATISNTLSRSNCSLCHDTGQHILSFLTSSYFKLNPCHILSAIFLPNYIFFLPLTKYLQANQSFICMHDLTFTLNFFFERYRIPFTW